MLVLGGDGDLVWPGRSDCTRIVARKYSLRPICRGFVRLGMFWSRYSMLGVVPNSHSRCVAIEIERAQGSVIYGNVPRGTLVTFHSRMVAVL